MKKILQNLLLAAISSVSLGVSAQGWVAGSTTSLNPVNSSLGLTPLNIGIGTASPSAQLHTTGTVRFAGIANNNALTRIMVQDTSGNVRWRDASTVGGSGWQLTGNTVGSGDFLGTLNLQNLRFRANNVERMVVTTDGNVGIGETSPNYVISATSNGNSSGSIDRRFLLSLNNTSTGTDAFTGARFQSSSTAGFGMLLLRGPSYTELPGFANTFGLQTSLKEGLILLSANADGTSNPNFGKIRFFVGTAATSNLDPIERMRIDSSGNVGVNTTAPTAQFHSKGTVRFENLPSGTGNVLVADANGNVFVSTSSARMAPAANNAEIEALKQQVQQLQLAVDNLLANKVIAIGNTDKLTILSIKPNPSRNGTIFNYYVPSSVSAPILHVYDTNGNEVKSYRLTQETGTNNFSMETLQLAQGTYLAAITGSGQVSNAIKLVVAK
jgi:hypothetical protein